MFLITAILYRVRGMDLGIGTQFNRILWSLSFAILSWHMHFMTIGAFIYPLLGWLSLICMSYSKYWNLSTWQDWLGMLWNGLIFNAAIALCAGNPWLILGAFWFPLAYWFGWKIPSVGKVLGKGPEWGELLFGLLPGGMFYFINV